jgi:hypothetical protein
MLVKSGDIHISLALILSYIRSWTCYLFAYLRANLATLDSVYCLWPSIMGSIETLECQDVVLTLTKGIKPGQHTLPHQQQQTSAVLHRSLHHDPLQAVSAKGNYLYLNNGQKIFDATGGAAVACLGHGNERFVFRVLLATLI